MVNSDNPTWVPGEPDAYRVRSAVREHLAQGHPGRGEDLPPEVEARLQMAAAVVARAFSAFAEGDWETCDFLVARGRAECGEVFTEFAEYVVSPALPYRVDSPAWDAFLARLAVMVLPPFALASPAEVESEDDFQARLHQLVVDGQREER